MSKLLALDQASRISGWAFFDNGELKEFGKIVVSDDDIGERLYKIRKEVQKLIDKFEIDEIVFEDIQLQTNVGNNVKTFKILAEVFGIIYELATELKIKNTAVLSGVWKSALGIKGKRRPDQKHNAQLYVNNTYHINPTQDECDAICIGAYATKYKFLNEDSGFDWSD